MSHISINTMFLKIITFSSANLHFHLITSNCKQVIYILQFVKTTKIESFD